MNCDEWRPAGFRDTIRGETMERVKVTVWISIAIGFLGGTPGIAAAATDFKVTLLGTGTPAPRPDRFGPSILVEAGSEKLVFDCGRSCTTRLWQLKIPLGSVKLFITHLHSDHTVGIPDLWLTGWLRMPYGTRTEPFM